MGEFTSKAILVEASQLVQLLEFPQFPPLCSRWWRELPGNYCFEGLNMGPHWCDKSILESTTTGVGCCRSCRAQRMIWLGMPGRTLRTDALCDEQRDWAVLDMFMFHLYLGSLNPLSNMLKLFELKKHHVGMLICRLKKDQIRPMLQDMFGSRLFAFQGIWY